jgi:hypothetical protein
LKRNDSPPLLSVIFQIIGGGQEDSFTRVHTAKGLGDLAEKLVDEAHKMKIILLYVWLWLRFV